MIAPIFELRFGRNRRWGSSWNKVMDGILGGWQISSMSTLRSGGCCGVNVEQGGNLRGDNAAGVALRLHVTGSPFKSPTQGEPAAGVIGFNWLNEGAFGLPDPYTLGNAGRTLPGIRGPARYNFAVMLAKNFRWGENWRARFSWEAYNFTNTPAFNIPNTALGSGQFGVVAGTLANSRWIMQVGLRITF